MTGFPQESNSPGSAYNSAVRPPSGYAEVARTSSVDLCPSRESLLMPSVAPKPGMAQRHNSQSSRSEQNTKQSASQKPTVHYLDDVGHEPQPTYFNTPPAFDSQVSSAAGSDAEDEDDDFDWSGDEDLEEEEAKFEKQAGIKPQSRYLLWRLVPFLDCNCRVLLILCRLFTFLFSTFIGSLLLAGILVTPALLVDFFWYKPHPTDDRRYVAQNVKAWLFWAATNVVISWTLAMIVDVIPVVTRMLISLSWGHVSEEVKTRIEWYNSIKDIFKPVLYASSAWISWNILFENIFHLHSTSSDVQSYAAYTDRVRLGDIYLHLPKRLRALFRSHKPSNSYSSSLLFSLHKECYLMP